MVITTLQRISELEKVVEAVMTQQSKFSRETLIQFLDETRAIAISNTAMGGTRLHPDWTQTHYCTYDAQFQDSDCETIFELPSAIKFKKIVDGYQWFGNNDGSVQYHRINSRGEYNNMLNHPMLVRKITNGVAVLVEDGRAIVYTKIPRSRIQQLRVNGIYNSPTQLSSFNIDTDNYPIDNTTFDWIKGYLKQTILNQMEQTPVLGEKTNRELSQFAVPGRRR